MWIYYTSRQPHQDAATSSVRFALAQIQSALTPLTYTVIASMRLRLNRRTIQTHRHKIVKQAKPGYLQSSQHWGSSITLNLVSNRRSNMRIATQYRHCFHLADLVGKAPTLSWLHLARLIIPFIAQVKAWIGKAEVQSKNLYKAVTPSIDSSRQKIIAVCSIFSTLQYCIYWSIPIHNRVLFLRYSPQLFDGGADSGCDLLFALNVLPCYAQPSGVQAKWKVGASIRTGNCLVWGRMLWR